MKVIELKYCLTEHIVGDVFTKAFPRDRHQRFVAAFGLEGFGYMQSGCVEVR